MSRWILVLAATLAAGGALAAPLKVKSLGVKSQQVMMCPDCKDKVACAKVGDYTVGFAADLENPKLGAGAVSVHLKDRAGKSVDDAKATVTLTMPGHGHKPKVIALKRDGKGRYTGKTEFVMPGGWQADVAVTLKEGDTVKQSFAFTR